LGKETRYIMTVGGRNNLIGISGKIGSGKDTVGSILQDYSDDNAEDYQIKKFATKLKEIAALLIGCDVSDFEDREFKEKELGEEWNGLTPRKILQLLGTEAGRNIIHPNIWVNALFADFEDSNWIITDVRFPNEAQAIKDRGGIVIRVERPGGESHCGGAHASETALDTYNFDYVIDNEGNIDELIDKVKQLKLV
jgi:hypothetical protein